MVSARTRYIITVLIFAALNIALFIYVKNRMQRALIHVPDEHIDNMYNLFKFMIQFFDRHDITYWAVCGTLIGALRNRPPGPVRWDDDII